MEESKTDFGWPFALLVSILSPIFKISAHSNLFITGVGKSGHISRKSVATWQSMGLPCQHLVLAVYV